MQSDADCVLVFNELPVVTDPADHPVGTSLLLVQDQTTHPGYCKLQLTHDGTPLWGHNEEVTSALPHSLKACFRFCPDKNNRLV